MVEISIWLTRTTENEGEKSITDFESVLLFAVFDLLTSRLAFDQSAELIQAVKKERRQNLAYGSLDTVDAIGKAFQEKTGLTVEY
jgi:hypothetical protein